MGSRVKSFGLGLIVGAFVIGMFFWWLLPRAPQPRPVHRSHPGTSAPDTSGDTVAIPAFDWRTVESEDYRKYISNLRSIGCPEQTIRDIIIADVNKLFEDRRHSLMGENTNRYAYWKSWTKRNALTMDEGQIKKQQQLARDKQAVLKELLGIDWEEKPEMPFELERNEQLDFLDSKKRIAVLELEQQFAARRMNAVMSMRDGNAVPRKLDELQKEQEASIAALLTPEELESYQLRRSPVASRMSFELEIFDPTEPEFQEIYKIRSQLQAGTSLENRLKGVLGDARYAEYARSQDSSYQAAYRIAEENGLNRDAANKIFEIKQAAEAQAAPVLQDYKLSRDERSAALNAIRAEADRAAHAVFSHDAIVALEDQGAWLSKIAAPASTRRH